MSKSTSRSIVVKGTTVTVASRNEQDYISLSDMVRNFEGQGALIENWLRAKDTVLFLGVWEQLNNPDFNSLEFEGIRSDAGRNSFILSPPALTKAQIQFVYASEADLLNAALFGRTAAEWRKENPKLQGNMRDHATLEQLVVLSNLESLNSVLIHQQVPASERLRQLNAIAIAQVRSLLSATAVKRLTPGKRK